MPQSPLNYPTDSPNYIRIRRGTPNAYKRLRYKDPNTLYFIAEKEATTGLLYMGDKLIAGGDTNEFNAAEVSLGQLKDVIQENAGDKDILIYDAGTNNWVNVSINEVISIMKGATADLDGEIGLVPQPKAGEEDMVLHGNGSWGFIDIEYPTVGNLDHVKQKLTDLDQKVGSLDSIDLANRVQVIENFMEIRKNTVTGAPVSILVNKVGNLEQGLRDANTEITNIKLRLTWQPYDNKT